jgi:hypothetical protein
MEPSTARSGPWLIGSQLLLVVADFPKATFSARTPEEQNHVVITPNTQLQNIIQDRRFIGFLLLLGNRLISHLL